MIKSILLAARPKTLPAAVVLVGHPKLQNDLRRPTMEEIGHRTTIVSFKGIAGQITVWKRVMSLPITWSCAGHRGRSRSAGKPVAVR